MSFSILNNIPALAAENQLNVTNNSLQKTLAELSSGSRINTGADDAAGLAVADGLMANITALTQSAQNASDGVGKLQVADGALSQVTTLLNRAVTLATESANGTLSDTERAPLQAEFASIQAEINRIGATTNFNGEQVFQNTNVTTYESGATNLTDATSLGGSAPVTYGATSVTGATLVGGTAAQWTSSAAQVDANPVGNVVITVATPGSEMGGTTTFTITSGESGGTVGGLNAYITANFAGQLTASDASGSEVIKANALTISNVTDSAGGIAPAVGGAGTFLGGASATVTIGSGGNLFTYTSYGLGTTSDLVSKVNADDRYSASLPGSGADAGKLVIGWGTNQAPTGTTHPTVGGTSVAYGAWTQTGAGAGGGVTVTVQPSNAAQATTFTDTGNLTIGALISDIQNMGLSASLTNGQLVIGDPNNPNNAPTVGGTATGNGTVLGVNTSGTASVAADTNIYLTDDSANAANTIGVAIGALSASNMNGASIVSDNLSTQSSAQSALTDISTAINDVAALRGTLGASVNRLQSATNVINNNIQNLTAAQNNIMAADIPSTVASMSQDSILEQTGVAALAQANQMQQLVLKLLQ